MIPWWDEWGTRYDTMVGRLGGTRYDTLVGRVGGTRYDTLVEQLWQVQNMVQYV